MLNIPPPIERGDDWGNGLWVFYSHFCKNVINHENRTVSYKKQPMLLQICCGCFCTLVQLKMDTGFDQAGFLSRCGKLSWRWRAWRIGMETSFFVYVHYTIYYILYIVYGMCLEVCLSKCYTVLQLTGFVYIYIYIYVCEYKCIWCDYNIQIYIYIYIFL